MESKYQCPYCQYMSLKKWNIDRHVKNIHRVKNFPDRNNVKLNIDPQNIRQLPCPIHSSDYRPNQEQQHDVIPHYHSKYQPSQEEHQYGKRFKDASTQYSENDINHSTIPLVVTNTANEIMQEKQAEIEYYRNIVESLESKKKYFIDLCSLSESDMQNYMRQCPDKDIQLICEACQRLHLYDDLKRDSLYKFIIALADKNVKVPYKRYILQSVGAELLSLIKYFIIPLLNETIEQDSNKSFHYSTTPLGATNTVDQIIQQPQFFEYDRNIYEDKSVENCKKRKPIVITSKGVFILE